MSINIAIDGPAGAGKSTVARRAAEKLGFIYVDTGAMYRAIALYLIRQGIAPEEKEAIAKECEGADVSITYQNGEQVVILNGENVNGLIRTDEVTRMSSAASAVPAVRARLLDLQRGLAARNNVLMDGRDIGTCVLPEADVKVYLTASTECRARRRYDELSAKGEDCDLKEIEADIRQRDERDMNREFSPLRQAEDAVLLDSSDLTVEEVIERILALCR